MRRLLLLTFPSLFLLLVGIELFTRFGTTAAEVPDLYFDPEWQITYFDTEGPRSGVFAKGLFGELHAEWRINNFGWNSEVDFATYADRARPLIALIGDSYIEGLHVDPSENVASVLRQRLGNRYDVYPFGRSGVAMSEYLQISRYVVGNFRPDILVFNLINNDFLESFSEIYPSRRYHQITPAAPFLELPPLFDPQKRRIDNLLKRSAAVRYWQISLRTIPIAKARKRLLGEEPDAFLSASSFPEHVREVHGQLIEDGLWFMVGRLRADNPTTPILFVLDAPRFDIYAGKPLTGNILWLYDVLRRACQENQISFLELDDHFARHYADTGEHFESELDLHWNEVGHREAGIAIQRELESLGWVD